MSIEILPNADALALRAADLFALAAQEAAAARGRFAAALSGGETPRAFYKMLARQQFSQKIPWRRVQVYWGDERCVPPDDPASNHGMAREALLKHVPLADAAVHRVHGEEAPDAAALAYDNALRALAALERPRSELPVFDLVLLGVGGDGHTASLFPHSDALAVEERFAVATLAPDGSPRVTVTYPVINAARRVWFLVSGAQKAGIVAEVLEGLHVPEAVPAQGVRPVHGKLTWLLDEAAAGELSPAMRGA
ncbi:6-phosphogluconolactonase [Zavarzinia sp.]|uniref:6-phosphogluconolactonase n=1 Tax=Zavarzinia sp. TaxID=2027920 RepID=UPI003569BB05